MKNLIFASLAFFAMSGCASTYEQHVVTNPASKLNVGSSILIATPADGAYGDEKYPGSGLATATAVRSAFARYSDNIAVSADCKDFECLNKGQATSYDYYVVPQILNWVDRATEWSGKKDTIEIKVTVYDAKDGKSLSSNVISGKSKWATFGGDHPQDLLPEPLNDYIKSLY